MRMVRTVSASVACGSAMVAIAIAQTGQAPTGTAKDPIVLMQADGTTISLQAQKASWKPIRAAFRAEARRGVPDASFASVKAPTAIDAPFSNRDLAGGSLFIVKLSKKGSEWIFQGDAAGTPDKGDIALKTSELKSVEKGTITSYSLDGVRALKPGRYAIVILDNQYMWPFENR